MTSQPPNEQVSIQPEEDARLPILEAQIERRWAKWRPQYLADLEAQGVLKERIHELALQCLQVLNDYYNRGLGADQGREAIQELIVPEPENRKDPGWWLLTACGCKSTQLMRTGHIGHTTYAEVHPFAHFHR